MRDVNMRQFVEHYSALLEDLSKAVEEQKNEKVDKKLTLQDVLGSLTEVQDLVK